jgi:hypothetical protein
LRGDRERPGQDYFPDEISAPVASLVTTRTMLSAAAVRGWHASLSDISGAFLQGKPITQTVYMAMPKGAIDMLCKINKRVVEGEWRPEGRLRGLVGRGSSPLM